MKALYSDFDANERLQMFFNQIVGEFERAGIIKPKYYLSNFLIYDSEKKIRLTISPINKRSVLDFEVVKFDVDFILPIYEEWSLQDDCEIHNVGSIISHWKEHNLSVQKENLKHKITSIQDNVIHYNEQIEKAQKEIEENLIKLENLKLLEQNIIN